MKVKRCFSFSDTNNTVQLVDDKGCPDPKIMSEFVYDRENGMAEARIFSMFKFPESSRVHFQCDIIVCRDMRGLCEHLLSSKHRRSFRVFRLHGRHRLPEAQRD